MILIFDLPAPFHLRDRQHSCKTCSLFAVGSTTQFLDSNAQIHARLQGPIGLQTQAFPAQVNGDCGLPGAISRAKKGNLDRPTCSESPLLSSFDTGFGWWRSVFIGEFLSCRVKKLKERSRL
jgi:hypothetical protein